MRDPTLLIGIEPTGPGVEQSPMGHSADAQFLKRYKRLGKAVCGHPITGEIEDEVRVQYFENVRMEYTVDTDTIRLGAVARYLPEYNF